MEPVRPHGSSTLAAKCGSVAPMIRKNPQGHLPVVHDSAYVDPMAVLCGRVVVHENVFIGPCAVIRADEVDGNGDMKPIVIGAHSNVQDGVVMHAKSGAAVTIGERTSIAHRAIVHGPCSVGDGAFIGFNSVLFDCAVGEGCVVGHGAVVEAATCRRVSTFPPRGASDRTPTSPPCQGSRPKAPSSRRTSCALTTPSFRATGVWQVWTPSVSWACLATPAPRRCWTSRPMPWLTGTDRNAEGTRFARAVSPLGGGVVAQFLWAVPLAIFLWVAALWAMGWLP